MDKLEEYEASSTNSASSQVLITTIYDLSKDECKLDFDDMSKELYSLHIYLNSLTKKNARIKGTNDLLLERNALLKNELLSLQNAKRNSR